ncbi:MAG TPA: nuclear transport factor 2 family protein [Thermoleophilaceae bacterium]|nr:nuclear transport factor 2 family protein [Thermoleophilaceae bacterium]
MAGVADGRPRVLDVLDPEIEWHIEDTLPDSAIYRGHAGVEEFFAGLRQVWVGLRFEADGFIEAGERVLVVARQIGRGAGSDVLVEQRLYPIFEMRAGRAVRMDVYFDRERATAALGPSA